MLCLWRNPSRENVRFNRRSKLTTVCRLPASVSTHCQRQSTWVICPRTLACRHIWEQSGCTHFLFSITTTRFVSRLSAGTTRFCSLCSSLHIQIGEDKLVEATWPGYDHHLLFGLYHTWCAFLATLLCCLSFKNVL